MNKIILGLLIIFLSILTTYSIESFASIIPTTGCTRIENDDETVQDICKGDSKYVSFCPISERGEDGCCDGVECENGCCPSGMECKVPNQVCRPTFCSEERNENGCCNLDYLKNCNECCADGITCKDSNECIKSYCSIDEKNMETGCCNIDNLNNPNNCEKCCSDGITCKEAGKDCPNEKRSRIRKVAKRLNFMRAINDKYQTTFETTPHSYTSNLDQYSNSLYSPKNLKIFQYYCETELSLQPYPASFKTKIVGFNSAYTDLPGTTRGICEVYP